MSPAAKGNAHTALIESMNGLLADCFALYLKTKNFHWHVSGPYFRDYHLLLDEQAAEILAATDAMAERARKTGNTTIRSIGDIARHQTIKDNDADFVTPTPDPAVPPPRAAEHLPRRAGVRAGRPAPPAARSTDPPELRPRRRPFRGRDRGRCRRLHRFRPRRCPGRSRSAGHSP